MVLLTLEQEDVKKLLEAWDRIYVKHSPMLNQGIEDEDPQIEEFNRFLQNLLYYEP